MFFAIVIVYIESLFFARKNDLIHPYS